MIKQFSLIIAWGSLLLIFVIMGFGLYFLIFPDSFAAFAQQSLEMPIQWRTVEPWQLYLLWTVSAAYMALSVAALYFLWRAFSRFSAGELFNIENSRAIRMFAIYLFLQALASPIRFALSSVILSANHPQGEKMLSLSIGSDTLQTIAYGMILWIVSELLIAGNKIEIENKQFV